MGSNTLTTTALVKDIGAIEWINRWAGSYTFISCSYWGRQYYHSLQKELGLSFAHTLFIHREGTASFYVALKEFRHLGSSLAKQSTLAVVRRNCERLQKSTDILLPWMVRLTHNIPTIQEYKKFRTAFERHLAYHVFVKKTVDFLGESALKKMLPYFTESRQYSEAVYSESERMFRAMMALIAHDTKYHSQYLTCLTQEEFEAFLASGRLPNKDILQQRYKFSILYFYQGSEHVITDPSTIESIEQSIASPGTRNEVKGMGAYPGTVRGCARIVLDPHHPGVFQHGDVLVTGMTRPEFMPLMQKAAAMVTDVGGILCHAAITARELKIPCVVGTSTATKTLRSGQMIEVDGNKGVVSVLS